ncbi:MAG: GTPase HflX [Acidimicrobiaceae bacterium]|nr:GTPase HflX [Acidimicrobiaceae bacterium]
MSLIDRSFREKILLVGVAVGRMDLDQVEDDLDELALLVDTAGAEVVGRVTQRRDRPDPATFIGSGKAEEVARLAEMLDVDTVVFDEELTPAQQRNLERLFGRTAIDRTAVILDIFAQNARTASGKAQVELALLNYRLPRLKGKGHSLSQQVGRIGTRGPGETKLEEDRRQLQDRISHLRRELVALDKNSRVQRKSRVRSRAASVSIVGYTNAGKSTLLNSLTDAGVLTEDRLFATLDPRTRRLDLPGGESVLLSDTVGFIRKLPHQLVVSFKSTLDVVAESDLLLHVVDASSAQMLEQITAVREVLAEIGANEVPEVMVFNKVDLLCGASEVTETAAKLAVEAGPSHFAAISATQGWGLSDLLEELSKALRRRARLFEIIVPFDRGDILAVLHREGEVISQRESDDGVKTIVRLDSNSLGSVRSFVGEHIEIRRVDSEY